IGKALHALQREVLDQIRVFRAQGAVLFANAFGIAVGIARSRSPVGSFGRPASRLPPRHLGYFFLLFRPLACSASAFSLSRWNSCARLAVRVQSSKIRTDPRWLAASINGTAARLPKPRAPVGSDYENSAVR